MKSLNNRHSTLTLTTIVYRLLAYQKAVEKGLFGGGRVSRVYHINEILLTHPLGVGRGGGKM